MTAATLILAALVLYVVAPLAIRWAQASRTKRLLREQQQGQHQAQQRSRERDHGVHIVLVSHRDEEISARFEREAV